MEHEPALTAKPGSCHQPGEGGAGAGRRGWGTRVYSACIKSALGDLSRHLPELTGYRQVI